MLLVVFSLPLIAALLCLVLSRVVPARVLGIVAALACLCAALSLGFALRADELRWSPYLWMAAASGQPTRVIIRLEGISWGLALLALVGSGLALLNIALSFTAKLRGFGGLLAALLLALLALLAGLAQPEFLPAPWAVLALLSFVAVRASGARGESGLPVTLLAGLAAALVLLGTSLWAGATGPEAATSVLIGRVIAFALVAGLPVFHGALRDATNAPASVAAHIVPLGLPLLGGAALLELATLDSGVVLAARLPLTIFGLLGLLTCAVGALRERRLKGVLGWQMSAQLSLLLLAVSHGAFADGATLLANAALTTLVGYLACAAVERHLGGDDLAAITAGGPSRLVAIALLIAGASAVGIPGTWGFWAIFDVLQTVQPLTPWALPLILAGLTLLAASYLAPLGALYRAAPTTRVAGLVPLLPLVAAVPLLLFGILPQLGWRAWSAEAYAPGIALQVVAGVAAIVLVGFALLLRPGTRRVVVDKELPAGSIQLPSALAESLYGLAQIAAPERVWHGVWDGLIALWDRLRRLFAPFGQRYYVAGLIISLVLVILLLLSG